MKNGDILEIVLKSTGTWFIKFAGFDRNFVYRTESYSVDTKMGFADGYKSFSGLDDIVSIKVTDKKSVRPTILISELEFGDEFKFTDEEVVYTKVLNKCSIRRFNYVTNSIVYGRDENVEVVRV